MVAAEAATGGKSRETRGKAAGNAPHSRGTVGWVSLLGADSTTMPLVAHENRNIHTLTHIEARRGEAVHAAPAAHAAPDAPALTPMALARQMTPDATQCKVVNGQKAAVKHNER